MEKYDDENENKSNRTDRNRNLYQEIDKFDFSNIESNSNAKVIEDYAKNIDIEKIKNYVAKLDKDIPQKRKSLLDDKGLYVEKELPEEDTKDYDIISVLEKARETKTKDYEDEKYKRLRDTQFDILKRIKIYEQEEEKNDEEFNTKEQTLVDLINTIATNKSKDDLVNDIEKELNKNEDTDNKVDDMLTKNVSQEDIEKEKIKQAEEPEVTKVDNVDKSFYTSSMQFSKDDFEEKQGSNVVSKIGMVLSIIIILVVIVLIINFVFDLNLLNYLKELFNK